MMSVALTELELTILLKMTCSDPPTPTSHVLGLLAHTWLNSHPSPVSFTLAIPVQYLSITF